MLRYAPSILVKLLRFLEESHKGIGHGSAFTPRPDSVTMYANTRGYSSSKGQAVEVSSNASAQCPISKAQCKQLLALFNFGIGQGANHHVASVSTSAAVSSMLSGATSVPAATGVPSTSMTSSDSAHSTFVDTMSDPFLPSVVEDSYSAGVDDFVTPVSIFYLSSLDIAKTPSSSHQHVPTVLPSNPTSSSSPIQVSHSDQDANSTVEVLHDKIRQLEKMHSSISK
nr:hypothetical protein CFP56_47612 [Quercus suber]